jgi:hypothetical protein
LTGLLSKLTLLISPKYFFLSLAELAEISEFLCFFFSGSSPEKRTLSFSVRSARDKFFLLKVIGFLSAIKESKNDIQIQ